jgi:hypothetical protein
MTQLLTLRRVTLVVLLVGVAWSFAACSGPGKCVTGSTESCAEPSEDKAPQTEREGDELLAGWAQAVTTPEDVKDPVVFIKIAGWPHNPKWLLAPRVVGVCKNPTADCGDTVTWRWLPPTISGATLQIERKPDQADCFELVELSSTVPVPATVNPDNGACPISTIWNYQVRCTGSEDCPPPLDPQVHIKG